MQFSCTRVAALLLLFSAFAVCAFGQAVSTARSDKGFYQYTAFGVAHYSSSGWINEAGFAAGYDFNRHFTVECGIPVYFLQHTDSTGAATQTSSALGDWFARVIVTPVTKPFHYATALTGTAPTGDQNLGVSPGKPTWNWLNHVDKSFSRYTPFGEFGVSNSISGDRHYQRSFTTLGTVATYRGGLGIDLFKFTSVEFSGYSVHGFGSQKIYSRKVTAAAASSPVMPTGRRPFETQHFTSGDSTLADDNGFNVSLSVNPVQRLDIGVSVNRSVSYELTTVSASVGFRLGHMQKVSDRE